MPKRRRAILLCGPARVTLAAIARELARADVSLFVQAAAAEVAATERLCRALARRGGMARVIAAELGGDAEARRLVARASNAGRDLEAVVICPSAAIVARARQPDLDEWRNGMAVGLRAPFFLAKQAGLHLARAGGRIVVALGAPARDAGPVAAVVHESALCLIEALAKALPSRVAVSAVVGGSRPAAAQAALIARGVRFFVDAERCRSGAILDLAAPRGRG